MPTVFLKGDLFRHEGLQALAHGCNCAGAMGKGIAVEFRSRFPEMLGPCENITEPESALGASLLVFGVQALGRETDIELVVFEEYEPAKDKADTAEVPAGAASGAIRD